MTAYAGESESGLTSFSMNNRDVGIINLKGPFIDEQSKLLYFVSRFDGRNGLGQLIPNLSKLVCPQAPHRELPVSNVILIMSPIYRTRSYISCIGQNFFFGLTLKDKLGDVAGAGSLVVKNKL